MVKIIAVVCVMVFAGLGVAGCGDYWNNPTPAPPRVAIPARAATPKRPTPTPAIVCPTPVEEVYFAVLADWSAEAGTKIGELGELSSDAGKDASLLFDPIWQAEVVLVLVLIDDLADEVDVIFAPKSVGSIYANWTTMASLMHEMTDLYIEGVDNLDSRALGVAKDRMDGISVLALRNAALIESFCR